MNKQYAKVLTMFNLWKNLWTSLWDSMWENCGKILWKTFGDVMTCVKVGFSTCFSGKSGKVFPTIYTSFYRGKRQFYTFST